MKNIITLLILLITSPVLAQINIGSIERVKLKPGDFDEMDLADLKASETYFVYRTMDEEYLDELKEALRSVWTITELNFMSYKEFKDGRWNSSHSFFTLGGYTRTTTTDNMSYSNTHIYLTLWMPGRKDPRYFARIEFFPDFKTYQKAESSDADDMLDYLYEEANLRNWFTGYLKNSLQFVNRKLENGETHWLFRSDDYQSLSPLKKDTLFIPDYALIKFNKFTGDESEGHRLSDLLKKYPYHVEVVTAEDLSDMILNRKDDFYYLSYIKSSTDKYVNVFNGRTGEMLYSKYRATEYNIDKKDFAKLAKAIN